MHVLIIFDLHSHINPQREIISLSCIQWEEAQEITPKQRERDLEEKTSVKESEENYHKKTVNDCQNTLKTEGTKDEI